jgi:predicted secreted hydrolase
MPVRASLSVAEALGGDPSGYARASGPRAFTFPDDHGPHQDYRTEWWYFTGNVRVAAGRAFGFQLTFFRTALASRVATRGSAWGARELYTAHFAVSDVAAGRFHAVDRSARGALGLAGAVGGPGRSLRVWVEDWTAESAGLHAFPLRLRAARSDFAIDLVLDEGKAPVLQGDRGLSRKSEAPGNASYYYSLTRMPVRGTIRAGGTSHVVSGLAWMDREWSTSALGPDQVGWDWFALQLADGREVMLYRLRRRDGSVDPLSQGTLIGPSGESRALAAGAVEVEVLDHWTSPRGGTRYPARWRLRVPTEGIVVEVAPALADQELDVGVRYWEGAVAVTEADGRPAGAGYVELVGYAEPAGPSGTVRE